MTDQASGPTPTEQRVVEALETIADRLTDLLARVPPPRPMPAETLPPADPVDASVAFLSGQWKRRPGNIIPAPTTSQLHTSSPPIGTQLDPWVRRDLPALDEESADAATRAIDS